MNELIRLFWNAAAITGAILVGVFTHDAGFVALTFFGGLIVPRMLGLVPRRRWLGFAGPGRGGWGRGGWGGGFGQGACGGWQGGAKGGRWQRFDSWHQEAHGQQPTPPATPPAATTV